MRFALFQSSPLALPAETAARALEQVPRLRGADAAALARNAHGVLLDALTREEADAAHAVLGESGVSVGEQGWLAPLAATITRRLRLEDGALIVLDVYGAETKVAWSDVLLIACGELPETQAMPEARTASRERGRGPDELAAAVLQPQLEVRTREVLDLVVRGPGRSYRIEANGFDYACLGERKQARAARNFRVLALQLAQRAVAALHNQGATALLTQHTPLRYDDEAGFARETSFWLWKFHAGELDRFARAQPSPELQGAVLALDPALLSSSPRAQLSRLRGSLQVMRTLAPLIAIAVVAWLLYLLNRIAVSGFEPVP